MRIVRVARGAERKRGRHSSSELRGVHRQIKVDVWFITAAGRKETQWYGRAGGGIGVGLDEVTVVDLQRRAHRDDGVESARVHCGDKCAQQTGARVSGEDGVWGGAKSRLCEW